MADDKPALTPPPVDAARAAVSAAASAMASRRMKLLGPKGRRELAGRAGSAQWAGWTAHEKSVEMRRRVALSKKRKAAAALKRAKMERADARLEKKAARG